MRKLSIEDFLKLRRLVFRGARPLEYTMWKCTFENGDREEMLSVLSCYQNEDGGFGHSLEANNWNPNSSPSITAYAIGQLDRINFDNKNHPVVRGILQYLASSEYLTERGWIGNIPSNNNFSHAPWFHYDPQKGTEVDIGVTNSLVSFILKYEDKDSALYRKALELNHSQGAKAEAFAPDFHNYDPTKWEPWNPLPSDCVCSPDSEYYPKYKDALDLELDAIVDRLHNTNALPVIRISDAREWEDSEQIIGSYYWAPGDFITQIEILRRFDRLDFSIPVCS